MFYYIYIAKNLYICANKLNQHGVYAIIRKADHR